MRGLLLIASAGFSEKGDSLWIWVIALWPFFVGALLFLLLVLGTFLLFWRNRKVDQIDWQRIFRTNDDR